MHKLGKPVGYVPTKGNNLKIKKENQEEFNQIKKEEITPLGVKEEGNKDIGEEDIDGEELKLVDPAIQVAKEDSKINRLEKQDSHEWTWSEPFTLN